MEIDSSDSDDVAEYAFSVAGSIDPGDRADSWDLVDGNTAIGQVGGGRDDFWVTGEFTEFKLDGDAVVRLDGETVGPDALVD